MKWTWPVSGLDKLASLYVEITTYNGPSPSPYALFHTLRPGVRAAGLAGLTPGTLHIILTLSGKAALELTPEAAAALKDVQLGKVSQHS